MSKANPAAPPDRARDPGSGVVEVGAVSRRKAYSPGVLPRPKLATPTICPASLIPVAIAGGSPSQDEEAAHKEVRLIRVPPEYKKAS